MKVSSIVQHIASAFQEQNSVSEGDKIEESGQRANEKEAPVEEIMFAASNTAKPPTTLSASKARAKAGRKPNNGPDVSREPPCNECKENKLECAGKDGVACSQCSVRHRKCNQLYANGPGCVAFFCSPFFFF